MPANVCSLITRVATPAMLSVWFATPVMVMFLPPKTKLVITVLPDDENGESPAVVVEVTTSAVKSDVLKAAGNKSKPLTVAVMDTAPTLFNGVPVVLAFMMKDTNLHPLRFPNRRLRLRGGLSQ